MRPRMDSDVPQSAIYGLLAQFLDRVLRKLCVTQFDFTGKIYWTIGMSQ
jgi:hypothetical protein